VRQILKVTVFISNRFSVAADVSRLILI